MSKILISKNQFAKLARVHPSTVTRLSKSRLKKAMCGDRIDQSHSDARQYLEERGGPEPVEEKDALYEKAVKICRKDQKCTVALLRKKLGIGQTRASRIMKSMRTNKDLPANPVKEPKGLPPAIVKKTAEPQLEEEATEEKEPYILEDLQLTDEQVEKLSMQFRTQEFLEFTLKDLIRRFGTDERFCDWLKAVKLIEDVNEKRLRNGKIGGQLVNRDLVQIHVVEAIDSTHIKMLSDGSKSIARRLADMQSSGRNLKEREKWVSSHLKKFIKPLKAKLAKTLRNA